MRTKTMDITGRKRFLALLLVFAFLCSFLLVRANAEEAPEDETTEEVTEEVVEETAEEESICCGEGCTMSCCTGDSSEVSEACSCSEIEEEVTYTATITVVDTDGNALSDASVTINDTTLTTDENGQAEFELASGNYTVTASLDGQSTESTLTIRDADMALTVTLESAASEELEAECTLCGCGGSESIDTCWTADLSDGVEDSVYACSCGSEEETASEETVATVSAAEETVVTASTASVDDGIAVVSDGCSACGCEHGGGCAYEDEGRCGCSSSGGSSDDDDDDYYDDYDTYTVTFNLTNLTKSSGSTTATEKTAYTAYLAANTGYSLPSSITVKVGSSTLSTSYYTYSSSTGKITIKASKVTGNITITASGVANSYTITWNYNDGSGTTVTTTQTYGSSLSLPTSPTRSGYTFDGWYTKASGGTKVTSSTTYSTAGATTYYAHWTQTTYSITYLDAGGEAFSGTLPDDAATEHTYGTETELPTPTRDGYSFNGWYLDEDCTELVTVLDDTNCTSDITLYASWSLIMSVTVPSTLVLVMAEDGTVYAATSAEITNNSYAAVEITSLTVVAAGNWTVVSYDYNMAGAKVDSNLIGIAVNGCETTQTASSESLTLSGDWAIDALSSLTLSYDAVISALSEAVTGESVLSLVCVVNWAA